MVVGKREMVLSRKTLSGSEREREREFSLVGLCLITNLYTYAYGQLYNIVKSTAKNFLFIRKREIIVLHILLYITINSRYIYIGNKIKKIAFNVKMVR